jgi:peroxiredoxin
MALIESIDIPLGTGMPSFTLKDPFGKNYSSDGLIGTKGLLVVFTCNHCPYAKAVWPRLIRIAHDARNLGIPAVAINPNIHPNYPDDRPECMIQKIKEWGITFPYLVDDTQETAKAFMAQCTPDIYLMNHERILIYHGRIDDNWQDEGKVTRKDLQNAINALADGKEIPSPQYPSMGCSIKWRSEI